MRNILFAALAIAALTAVTSAQTPNIAIGVVRQDGFLMPITMLGDLFVEVSAFPVQTRVNGVLLELTTPKGPAQSFEGRRWTLAPGSGAAREEIRTFEASLRSMPYCGERLLWRTTLERPPVDATVAPVPKLGLAVSGAEIYLPDDVARQPDAAGQRVANRIIELFLEKEASRLAREQGPHAASMAPGNPAVAIRKLFRHAAPVGAVYYFEATRALKLADGSVAGSAGLVTGWIVDSPLGLTDHEVVFKIGGDAYKEHEDAVVRGIVPFRGRMLWILEWHGWEHEFYTVHEWPSGTRLETINAYEC